MPKKQVKAAKKYNRIGEMLYSRGRTQAWLAGELEMEYRTINRYVNNHRQPSLEMLFQIAKKLKVQPSDLLESDKPNSPDSK